MPNHRVCREIVETDEFADELAALISDARRADEFIDAAKWLLCRFPMQGTLLTHNPAVWFLPVNASRTVTPVVLYYTFTTKQVFFLSIRRGEVAGE